MASVLLPPKTEFRFLSKLCEGIRDKKVECNFVFLDPIKVQFWSFLKVNAITIFHIFLQKVVQVFSRRHITIRSKCIKPFLYSIQHTYISE